MRLSWNRLAVLMAGLIIAAPAVAQFPGQGGGRGQSIASLLQNESVQKEINLTEEQKTKLKTLTDGIREKFKEEIDKAGKGKGAFEIFGKIREATTEAITKEGDKILKPEQMKRIKQIELQQQGLNALSKEAIQKELKLSDDQVTKIKGVVEDVSKDIQAVFKEAGKDFTKAREATTKIRTAAQEKVNDLLNDSQKKQWKEMQGEKFELKQTFGPRPGA